MLNDNFVDIKNFPGELLKSNCNC